jgi:hypothetical protein
VTCIPSLLSQNVRLFFLTPSGWHAETGIAWERGDFHDQSRIAGVCREIRMVRL